MGRFVEAIYWISGYRVLDIPFSETEKNRTNFLFVHQLCLYLSAARRVSASVDACFLWHSFPAAVGCYLPHNRASAVSYTSLTALSLDAPSLGAVVRHVP